MPFCFRLMGFVTLTFFVVFVFRVVSSQTTDPDEVAALNKLIEYWNLTSKLNITSDPCVEGAEWANANANPRVACDCNNASSCHITHLKISALDIAGEIPKELFMLKELVDLSLDYNILNGSIPAEFGQLSNMQYLSLATNNFTGPVPQELGNLTKLVVLNFSSNSLTGELPPSLGNLTSLKELYIDSSGVGGPIPREFSNLISLQTLWASDNHFTGRIPDYIGTFAGLHNLRLQGTSLEGPIPISFSALTQLKDLRIGDLTGDAPSFLEFLQNQSNLSILILRNCLLTGEIPEQLGTFSKLKLLDLSFNNLTGQIPTSFQNLSSLQHLFLGSNELIGEIPTDIINPGLIALDVSFNSLSGNPPHNFARRGLSMNIAGTSINTNGLPNRVASGRLQCLESDIKCKNKVSSSSFSINCGGKEIKSATGIEYDDDSETVGTASFFAASDGQWAVTNVGTFISNPNGPIYVAETESHITGTSDSELYKTARISPSSLRYYGLGLQNGMYNVDLHFAEISMSDSNSNSWKGLGRRLFDVYIQGDRVLKDFNIKEQAGGSNRAVVQTFEVNVTNTIMDIHFFWAGKGTCCIPFQSTYGPLVSAIHVSAATPDTVASKSERKHIATLTGVAAGCTAGLVIIASVIYLWWLRNAPMHLPVHTDSPNK